MSDFFPFKEDAPMYADLFFVCYEKESLVLRVTSNFREADPQHQIDAIDGLIEVLEDYRVEILANHYIEEAKRHEQ